MNTTKKAVEDGKAEPGEIYTDSVVKMKFIVVLSDRMLIRKTQGTQTRTIQVK